MTRREVDLTIMTILYDLFVRDFNGMDRSAGNICLSERRVLNSYGII